MQSQGLVDVSTMSNRSTEQTHGNWDHFLDSLKSYLETGKGTPGFPQFV